MHHIMRPAPPPPEPRSPGPLETRTPLVKPPILLLFDIDGTLLLTHGAGMRAMRRAARILFGDHWSWDRVNYAGHLDTLIFRDAATLNGLHDHDAHHDRFRSRYIEELRSELRAQGTIVHAMPGILDLLGRLRQRERERGDIVLGLLTGNYTAAVPLKLSAVGIDPDWFSLTAFAEEAPDRPGLVAVALRKYAQRFGASADPRRVVVIGDTPRDIHCAKAHRCVAFTVATGDSSLEALRLAGADHALPDLSDPTALLRLLDD